ncbi:MAG: DUF4091 domain-containing protein [Polyangiaceae bacterium]|nr:DUF4091 domain-containing protein [Polyangiaceae bacterium]
MDGADQARGARRAGRGRGPLTRSLLFGFAIGAASFASIAPAAAEEARACFLLEGERVRKTGDASGSSLDDCRTVLSTSALREEHVSFQIVVEAGDKRLEDVSLSADDGALQLERFVEHFVDVPRRSRTYDGPESLAFTTAARAPDSAMLGLVPDALIPIDIAPRWAPYPLVVEPRQRGVVYFEAFIPRDIAAGSTSRTITVEARGRPIATLTLSVDVIDATLPYNVTGAFTFYERSALEKRFDDPSRVEREIAQLLHRHHLEAMNEIVSVEDADRVAGATSGVWFTKDAGYRGPGAGVPTSLFVIGSYGSLGPPNAAALPAIDAIASRAPATAKDLFVYAVDETCDSPYGPAWRALLRHADIDPRVKVGHTCHEDPSGQDVDVIMIPAQAFDPELAEQARAQGKRVWIYNGKLPYGSPVMLDVPLTGLTINGWIGATFDVGRWFYWESIFWDDKNRGGQGPRDVFASAETFHNADGDTALYDGLLLYPQRMPAFAEHDLGRDGVLPSLRLKALRRGLEDAALLSLAARVDAGRASAIAGKIVPAALDEVGETSPLSVETDPRALDEARGDLRAIIAEMGPMQRPDPASVERGLAALRADRERSRIASGAGQQPSGAASVLPVAGIATGLFALGAIVSVGLRPSRGRKTRSGRSST